MALFYHEKAAKVNKEILEKPGQNGLSHFAQTEKAPNRIILKSKNPQGITF